MSVVDSNLPAQQTFSVMRTVRACVFLFRLTLWRQIASRQTLVNFGLTTLCALIVAAWSHRGHRTAMGFSDYMLLPTFIGFLMPIFAISYGSSTIGGEREDQSLIYLLVTPIPRAAIYLTKAIAVGVLVALWSGGALTLLCWLAGEPGQKLLLVYLPASLLGGLMYASVFLLLGAMFRHGTILSLAYWFFLEVLLLQMPGTVKRITVSYYIHCMLYDAGSSFKLGPRNDADREMFAGISGDSAAIVLVFSILGLMTLGSYAFSKREYTELG